MKKFGKRMRMVRLVIAGVVTVCLLGGCGGSGGVNGDAVGNGIVGGSADGADAEKSMGRYLEEELEVPEVGGGANYEPDFMMQRLSDGKLLLTERIFGDYVSADDGESWESAGCLWDALTEDNYVSYARASASGAVALICSPYEYEDGETAESQGVSEKDDSTEGEADEDSESVLPEWRYYYITAEGVMTELFFPGREDDFFISFAFDREGRLYGFGSDRGVYRFDVETGKAKEIFSTDSTVGSACFTERYMTVITNKKTAVIYDLEQETVTEEDRVLQDFLQENAGQATDLGYDGCSIAVAAGEQEDIIYLAAGSGVYRHVIGGTMMEQIIDGNMTTLGNPSVATVDMAVLPDNVFLILFTGGKLCKYTYDPDVPTVPEKRIAVYSLTENTSLRQAASLFQKEHTDVYVQYEIGLSGEDGMTREDAVRNLNTKIMAGEGPDVLLLDGLPQKSYEEKGVLADVSAVADSMDGDAALFPNVVDACRKNGKLYALPIRIQIPMMMGKKEDTAKIHDLDSLAGVVEKLREENPDGALIGLKSAEQVLQVLSLTSSAAWTDESGNIDEKAIAEFLTAAKRIWQAELSGVDEDRLAREENYSAKFAGEGAYYATTSNQALQMATGEQKFSIGKVYKVDFDFDTITSIAGAYEEFGYGAWNGQAENIFIPDGMAAVTADAAEDELVMEFYRFLFGRQVQDMDLAGGFPVNMASFDSFALNPYEDNDLEEGFAGGIYMMSENRTDFSLDLIWPDKEEFAELKKIVSSATVIGTGDTTIEEAVFEVGEEVLDGDISVEEGVQEIMKKAAIYLAE